MMLAARWHARGDIRIESTELRAPLPHEVVVRVLHCGICGTDLEEFRAGPLTIPAGAPHPQSGRSAPLTLGHEVVGVVTTAAADGSGPAEGTLVVPDVVNGCGECWWCQRHQEGQCPSVSVPGQQDDGGLAEYMIARAATCVPVPDGLSPEVAVLTEPAAVAVRAVRKITSPLGSTVVVIGGGTIGQLTAQVALAAGAATCVLVDPSPFRRSLLADRPGMIVSTPEGLSAVVAGIGGRGVDVVIECSGIDGQLGQAISLVRAGGTVIAVGLRSDDQSVPFSTLVLGERSIIGSAAHLWDDDVIPALDLLASGRIDPMGLVTHHVPLRDLTAVALPLLAAGGEDVLKVVIDC